VLIRGARPKVGVPSCRDSASLEVSVAWIARCCEWAQWRHGFCRRSSWPPYAGGFVTTAEASFLAPFEYFNIVWAAVFGAVFFDERIGYLTMLGTAMIIVAALIIKRKG